jgi:neurabin
MLHRRSKKVSSICIELPAAGLGQRPPSIHSSVTTDEGGFNEPSPEIKALKTVYTYENTDVTNSHPDVISDITYVDLAHRAQPEGIESDQTYDENESYRKKIENGSTEIVKEKVVYATIKTDLPIMPVKDLLYERENILDEDVDESNKNIEQDIVDRGYISPQKILDPTRARLHDDKDIEELFNRKLPPEPVSVGSETETEEEEMLPPVKLFAKKIPPPIPELNSPLDLQDVEYADASDHEENDVNTRKISEEVEQSIPDAMTHDEAERLLSSRYKLDQLFVFFFLHEEY